MSNITKIVFFTMMIFGISITICSETWLGMWMGLEINLISFIPILFLNKNMVSSESCMIYFLIQSFGSIIFLITILSSSLIYVPPSMIEDMFKMVLLFSMMVKLGMPPFHFWFPEILEKMNWTSSFILMTIQKIAPMSIMNAAMSNNTIKFMPVIIMITVIIGAVGGLNQTSIRKIMAYSSINHMGWMIACMIMHSSLWIMYLIMYSTIILMMIYTFNTYMLFHINQFNNLNIKFSEKLSITILFLSLGGLPPFIGFFPKWIVIQLLTYQTLFLMMFIMVMSTLITLFYYLRLSNSILLLSSISPKWISAKTTNSLMVSFIIAINLSLPILTFSI